MLYNKPEEFFNKIKIDKDIATFLLGAQLDFKENHQEDKVYLQKMTRLLKRKEIDNEPIKITKRPFGYVFDFEKKMKVQLQNIKENKYKIIIK